MDVLKRLEEHKQVLEEKGYEVVGIFLYGSQNYGVDTNNSDVDSKAIVLPTFESIIRGSDMISRSVNMGNGETCDVKDIREMFTNFLKQNINFTEMLFTDYKIINEKYKDEMELLIKSRDKIITYNQIKLMNCIKGMSYNKLHLLKTDTERTHDDIVKYGYSPKEFHHIHRLNEFITRLIKGETFEECLKSSIPKFLKTLKTSPMLNNSDDVIGVVANKLVEDTKKKADDFIKNHVIDSKNKEEVESIFYEIKFNCIKKFILEQEGIEV